MIYLFIYLLNEYYYTCIGACFAMAFFAKTD